VRIYRLMNIADEWFIRKTTDLNDKADNNNNIRVTTNCSGVCPITTIFSGIPIIFSVRSPPRRVRRNLKFCIGAPDLIVWDLRRDSDARTIHKMRNNKIIIR